MNRILALLAAVGFALTVPATAQASPFSTLVGPNSQLPGGSVAVTLQDSSAVDLEAVDLQVVFDPSVLSFSAAMAGSLTTSASIGFNVLIGQVSLVLSAPANGNGGIVVVSFDVMGSAPLGPTTIGFVSTSTDYVIPLTQGTLTITAVPEPRAWAMLAAGLALVGVCVARRPRTASGSGQVRTAGP